MGGVHSLHLHLFVIVPSAALNKRKLLPHAYLPLILIVNKITASRVVVGAIKNFDIVTLMKVDKATKNSEKKINRLDYRKSLTVQCIYMYNLL